MEVKATEKNINELAKMLVELTNKKDTKLILSRFFQSRNKSQATRFTEEEIQSNVNLTIAKVCSYARKKGNYDPKYIKFAFWKLLKKINLTEIEKLKRAKREDISDYTHDSYSEFLEPENPTPYKNLATYSADLPSALSQLEDYENMESLKSYLKTRQDMYNETIPRQHKKHCFYDLFLQFINQEDEFLKGLSPHKYKETIKELLEELNQFRLEKGFSTKEELVFRKPSKTEPFNDDPYQKLCCSNSDCKNHLKPSKQQIVKKGFCQNRNETYQRFLCKLCKSTFKQVRVSNLSQMRTQEDIPRVLELYKSGLSIRGVSKVVNLNRETVAKIIRISLAEPVPSKFISEKEVS